jgi:hypothetical protein
MSAIELSDRFDGRRTISLAPSATRGYVALTLAGGDRDGANGHALLTPDECWALAAALIENAGTVRDNESRRDRAYRLPASHTRADL